MRRFAVAAMLLSTAVLNGCTMENRPGQPAARAVRGEAALAKHLADRSAGAPESCINLAIVRGSRVLSDNAIVFGDGRRVYVNRPPGCDALRPHYAFVTRTPTAQLCRGDIVEIVDPGTDVTHGSCSLGDFVPYERR